MRASVARLAGFLRAMGRDVVLVFVVILALVALATAASLVATAGLGLISFVPLIGLAAFPKVQFDLEEHEPAKIAACLERWRELQPRRDTSRTLEPFQGGWMTPDFVQRVLGCRVRVVPQFYMGPSVAEPFDMRPAAGDMVLRDLTRRGFPESLVTGFYDAALVTPSSRWNGFAFTQGGLP